LIACSITLKKRANEQSLFLWFFSKEQKSDCSFVALLKRANGMLLVIVAVAVSAIFVLIDFLLLDWSDTLV